MEKHVDESNDQDRILQPDPENIILPNDLEEKVVEQLKLQNMIVPARPWLQRTWSKVAASLIVAIGVFGAGYFSGKDFRSSKSLALAPTQEYLLLLYNPINFASDPQQVDEYGAWLESINSAGIAASGEELKDNGWTIKKKGKVVNMEGKPVSCEFGSLSGYFLLRSPSQRRALEIAASCPHVKYNGVIELRPIQQH